MSNFDEILKEQFIKDIRDSSLQREIGRFSLKKIESSTFMVSSDK